MRCWYIIGMFLTLCACLKCQATEVLLLRDRYPDSSERLYSRLRDAVRAGGYTTKLVDGRGLRGYLDSARGTGTILVLPNSRFFPSDARLALERFLKRGNHLLAVSGPALSQMAIEREGKWLSRELSHREMLGKRGERILSLGCTDRERWSRATESPRNEGFYRPAQSGDRRVSDAMHVRISRLDAWDLLMSGEIERPLPEGFTSTAFWAKGGPQTPELVVQWQERDGSRWIGVVQLTQQWKRYVLLPEEFRFWYCATPGIRGQAGDRFHPENARQLSFGLANGMTTQRMGISHEYWIADIRAVKDDLAGADLTQPVLEGLSPSYKTYCVSASSMMVVGQGRVLKGRIPGVTCTIQRSQGFGADGVRRWRQIPVMYALGPHGERLGAAAHLFLSTGTEYAGSIWGFIGIPQGVLEQRSEQIVPIAMDMLHRMTQGIFLANAGSDAFAYAEGDETACGAFLTNYGYTDQTTHVTTRVLKGKSVRSRQDLTVTVPARTVGKPVSATLQRVRLEPGEYVVEVTLSVGGKPVDRIRYPFRVIRFGKVPESETVSVRNGSFRLNGREWRPFGMNYYPRYVIGIEDFQYWIRWLAPEEYDPVAVEEDLAQIARLKMNMVSITCLAHNELPALMDFLARAQRHHIKVNLYMPGLHPLYHYPDDVHAMMRKAHLSESPALFAYDLGIEVHVGGYADRKQYDGRWQKWVADQYGSIDSACKNWGFSPDRIDGVITGPKDDQLMTDGAWRVFVAAYRRFWDDEISKGYRAVRGGIRSVDPIHLIGAKSGWAGTGSTAAVAGFPFDLCSGVKHLDFTSPEAYNVHGNREEFLKGGLTTAYARLVSGGKPVFWAEYGPAVGFSIEPHQYRGYTLKMQQDQRDYYAGMMRMVRETDADGCAGWWWASGYRVDEKSDLGIMGQDLVPRLSALQFPANASVFLASRLKASPSAFLTIDRDRYVTGYAGIYQEFAEQYVRAFIVGRVPGLRTGGTGTDSSTCSLEAVGNVPYNGSNPPKYLNAEFNSLLVNGVPVQDGAVVGVERGMPIYVQGSVGNTGEAKWLNNGKQGTVYMSAKWEADGVRVPVRSETGRLHDTVIPRCLLLQALDKELTITFRMAADSRCEFGEVRRVTLRPR